MTNRDALMAKYPQAFEDEKGNIWVSEESCLSADWTYAHGDAFLEGILGWDWDNAVENFIYAEALRRKREFWRRHPILRRMWRFLWTRYHFVSMFSRTVWRDWYGRISWSLAWKLSSDLWLK